MREAGEVVCLKVHLGRNGEGLGDNAVREVGSVGEGGKSNMT